MTAIFEPSAEKEGNEIHERKPSGTAQSPRRCYVPGSEWPDRLRERERSLDDASRWYGSAAADGRAPLGDLYRRVAVPQVVRVEVRDPRRLAGPRHHVLGDVGEDTPHCPTCHQALTGTLIELPHTAQVMSVDDNLALIEHEVGIFRAMREDSERVLTAKGQSAVALRDRTTALQREIRSAKRTLVANGKTPSEAAIARRVRLQDRLELWQAPGRARRSAEGGA
jgi:hypothetical protein